MSKKLCTDRAVLKEKMNGRKKRYICASCDMKSPKEKWVCNPKEIRR